MYKIYRVEFAKSIGELTSIITGEVSLDNLIELIIRGGWPGNIHLPIEQASLLPAQYLDAIIDDDVYRMDGIFEALCERDLKIYAESFGGSLYHYQDYLGREVDSVIELPDGRWCAFEIKLGAGQIDSASEALLSLQSEINSDEKGKPPSMLCVICGMSNAAYQRPDGVFVVPLTALKN